MRGVCGVLVVHRVTERTFRYIGVLTRLGNVTLFLGGDTVLSRTLFLCRYLRLGGGFDAVFLNKVVSHLLLHLIVVHLVPYGIANGVGLFFVLCSPVFDYNRDAPFYEWSLPLPPPWLWHIRLL